MPLDARLGEASAEVPMPGDRAHAVVVDAPTQHLVHDGLEGRRVDQVQQYRDGNKKVVGFLVGQCMKASKTAGANETPRAIRERLGRCIPSYMVPRSVRLLERMPLTSNAQIDRKQLMAS